MKDLSHLNLQRFGKHLKKLCLRQNLISTLDPEIFRDISELSELDLYDNKIKHVGSCLETLPHLRCVWINTERTDTDVYHYSVLDLSFNLLKSVPDEISHLHALQTIYFVQNRITKINNLSGAGATLRSLELGGNRIRVSCVPSVLYSRSRRESITQKIENLSALVNLEELWLGKNKITKLEVSSWVYL